MMCTRSATVGLLLLAACGKDKDSDSGTSSGTATGACAVELVGEALPTSLYSVWGTSASDVWMVGGDDGAGPVVVHYDGSAFSRVATGTAGDLWWVWGDSADSLWMAGKNGRVVHHTPSTGASVETVVADPLFTLYGVWGASASDIWAVGGASDGSPAGVVVHYDGTDWTTVTDVPASGVVFKVWGSGPSDVWFVGPGALLMHFDGAAWTQIANPFPNSPDLFTVAGCGQEIVAVGGFGNAAVAYSDDGGATWSDDSPPPLDVAPRFTGVAVDCTHGTVSAGNSGALWTRNGAWAPTCDIPVTVLDYHGAWIDPDGGIWAVGGHLTSGTDGIVAYAGTAGVPQLSL